MFGLMGVARLSGQPGGAWSPLRLFAASEQGAWYDPSDFASMFQDSAGTTPVTAVEQPVGLILDKRLGLVLGPELVPHPSWTGGYTVNGAKQTPLAWDEYTGANISASTVTPNSYQFTATSHLAGIELPSTSSGIALGDFISCTVRARKTAFVSGTPSLQMYTGDWHEIVPVSASIGDWYEKTVRVAFTNTAIILSNFNGAASWEVEFISAKKLFGNHASQPTAAARPILRQDGGGKYYLEFDGVDDFLETAAVNLTSTSQLSVFCGFASDTSVGSFAPLYGNGIANSAGTAGKFSAYIPANNGTIARFDFGGVTSQLWVSTAVASNVVSVLTHLLDSTTAPQQIIRQDGTQTATGTFDVGSQPFVNAAIKIADISHMGGGHYYKGKLYGIVIRGALSSAGEIDNAEAYIAGKSGVSL